MENAELRLDRSFLKSVLKVLIGPLGGRTRRDENPARVALAGVALLPLGLMLIVVVAGLMPTVLGARVPGKKSEDRGPRLCCR
jgi:hypothetical protein